MEKSLVKKEIKKPKIVRDSFGIMETTPETKVTTYECSFSFVYTVRVEEEIKPGKNSKGRPNPKNDKKRIIVDVGFPFNIMGMKGGVKLPVYATEIDETPNRILEEIGAALVKHKVRPLIGD